MSNDGQLDTISASSPLSGKEMKVTIGHVIYILFNFLLFIKSLELLAKSGLIYSFPEHLLYGEMLLEM